MGYLLQGSKIRVERFNELWHSSLFLGSSQIQHGLGRKIPGGACATLSGL